MVILGGGGLFRILGVDVNFWKGVCLFLMFLVVGLWDSCELS